MASIFETEITSAFYNSTSTQGNGNNKVCLLSNNATYHGNKKLSDTSALINAYKYYYDDKYNYQVVDLGLPSGTLWSTKNLGALTEKDYGWYASWGNTQAYASGYDFSDANYDTSPAASISTDLDLSQDVVHQYLGGSWHLPTAAQFQELKDYTTWEWVNNGGVAGMRFGREAMNVWIFLPAAGRYDGTSMGLNGTNGYYRSSTFVSSTNASVLTFDSNSSTPNTSSLRRYGFSIRPVIG